MQHRMKEFSMTPEATLALLGRGQVGVLSTSGADGAPYGVPVHYLWQDGKLWFHGLPAGEKLENIARDHRVCFTVWEFGGILTEGAENPCQADAAYECAVLRGKARLVDDPAEKRRIFLAITEKYAPEAFWICPFPRPASPVQPWWKSPLSPSPASITADGFLFPPCPVFPEQGGFPLSRPEKVAIPGGNDYNGVCKSCPGTGAVRGGEPFCRKAESLCPGPG